MAILSTVRDYNNDFLSRREITCDFAGLGGKLQRTQAVEMVSAEFGLDGKMVIPIKLKHQMGRNTVTGTFYVYEDERLAKKHVNPTVFARLERHKGEPGE